MNEFTAEEIRRADQLAKEIENSDIGYTENALINRHLLEERNKIELKDNDEDMNEDEEFLYSAVIPENQGGNKNTGKNHQQNNSRPLNKPSTWNNNQGTGVLVQRGSGLPNFKQNQNPGFNNNNMNHEWNA